MAAVYASSLGRRRDVDGVPRLAELGVIADGLGCRGAVVLRVAEQRGVPRLLVLEGLVDGRDRAKEAEAEFELSEQQRQRDVLTQNAGSKHVRMTNGRKNEIRRKAVIYLDIEVSGILEREDLKRVAALHALHLGVDAHLPDERLHGLLGWRIATGKVLQDAPIGGGEV